MTTDGAYNAGLPCQNPSCKSHGKPHPNCRCYGEMAAGGAVEPYCSKNQPHKSDCEYFSGGGSIGHFDSSHAIAGHIFNRGLLGILRMDSEKSLEKYDLSVKSGHKNLDAEIDRVLKDEKLGTPEDRSKHHKAIEDWISKGGVNHNIHEEHHNPSQMMAEGGRVKKPHEGVLHNHPVEHAYPEQNLLLQSTKGRVSNYLGSLKPQEHVPKLAFDDRPDSTAQNKSYKKALKIADSPMSVLHEISRGTVDPESVLHLGAMYPEVKDAMQKKATEKIIQAQLDGKKPNRKVRQGLSLFMGTALSGELTPMGIQAAQAAFAVGKSQQQPPNADKAKKNTAPLSKSDNSFLTGNQTLVSRQQQKS